MNVGWIYANWASSALGKKYSKTLLPEKMLDGILLQRIDCFRLSVISINLVVLLGFELL